MSTSLACCLLTISDTRDEVSDTSGKLLGQKVQDSGHELLTKTIVPDDVYRIRAEVSAWIADPKVQVVITSGGTGLTGRDGTPEAIRPLLDKELDGFGELFRWLSYDEIGASTIQSRCVAGVANATLVFCLPGSQHACALGWDKIIGPQLDPQTKPCSLFNLIPRLAE